MTVRSSPHWRPSELYIPCTDCCLDMNTPLPGAGEGPLQLPEKPVTYCSNKN